MGSDVRFRPAAMNCSHRFFSLEAFFASAADSGFEAVELWTGPMHFFLDYASNDTPEKITRLANSFGLDVCALCPEQNNPKPANIAARGEESIKRTKNYFLRAINVASELGVEIVVVTPGWGFLDEERTEAWKRSVYMLGDLSSYATCKGIVLAVNVAHEVLGALREIHNRRKVDNLRAYGLACREFLCQQTQIFPLFLIHAASFFEKQKKAKPQFCCDLAFSYQ